MSAKEGAANGITAIFGSDVTNAFLCMSDGSNRKGVDNYTPVELVAAAITGTDRPAMNDGIDHLQDTLGMTFNFTKKSRDQR